MKITFEENLIKCDTVGCNKTALARLDIGSYKGLIFFCSGCLSELKTILRRNNQKNEQSEK